MKQRGQPWRGLKASQQGLRASQRGDVHMDGRMDRISPHSTGLLPLSGPPPKKVNPTYLNFVTNNNAAAFKGMDFLEYSSPVK